MVEIDDAPNDLPNLNAARTKSAHRRLGQSQLGVFRDYDLMPLPGDEIENAQNFVHLRIRIDAHAAVIHDHE